MKRFVLMLVVAGVLGGTTAGVLSGAGWPWWAWWPITVAEGWVLGKVWPLPRCRSCEAGIHRHFRTAECQHNCHCTDVERAT